MNLLRKIMSFPKEAICATSEGISYTYNDLCVAAISVRSEAPKADQPTIQPVIHPDPIVQLCDVLAFEGTNTIPLILPADYAQALPDHLPQGACLAVVDQGELLFPDLPVWLAEADRTIPLQDLSDPEQLRTALATLLEGGTLILP